MMRTTPPLLLNRQQAERLLTHMQEYRRSALAAMPATHERNNTLRVVQALQGTLLTLCDPQPPQMQLPMSQEEVTALKAMAKCVLRFYAAQPESPERTLAVTDIGQFYVYIKQIYG